MQCLVGFLLNFITNEQNGKNFMGQPALRVVVCNIQSVNIAANNYLL